jgi:hypothetical protein
VPGVRKEGRQGGGTGAAHTAGVFSSFSFFFYFFLILRRRCRAHCRCIFFLFFPCSPFFFPPDFRAQVRRTRTLAVYFISFLFPPPVFPLIFARSRCRELCVRVRGLCVRVRAASAARRCQALCVRVPRTRTHCTAGTLAA